MPKNRVITLVGNYGSGKTELAINMVLDLAHKQEKVALVDLDIINPYFRSREKADLLKAQGVKVILPQSEYIMSEAPALPPEISGYLANHDYRVVLDVGGDNTGATALGRYDDQINEAGYSMLMVVNTNRPDTDSPAKVTAMLKSIEKASGLKVTGLVNNSNLAWETDLAIIEQGQAMLAQVASSTGLPIEMITADRHLYQSVVKKFPGIRVFPIDIMMRLSWAQN